MYGKDAWSLMLLQCLFSLAMVSGVFFQLITIFFPQLFFPWASEILAWSSDGHWHYQLYQAWHLLLVSDSPHRWCFSTWTTLSNMTFTYKISKGCIRGLLIIFTATGHFLIIPTDNLLVYTTLLLQRSIVKKFKIYISQIS